MSRSPLFQVMFIMQNAPMGALELEGLKLETVESKSSTSRFDITLAMMETAEGLLGWCEYNTDLFDGMTIERMLRHWEVLLDAISADPEKPLSELPMLTDDERHQLLVEWNKTATSSPREQTIHEIITAQAARTPNAVAIECEDSAISYTELNRRANQLAHHLRRLGVGPEVRVGLCVERSVEMVVSLLAILKAGGAYVPLDAGYPHERLQFIADDARLSMLIIQQKTLAVLPSDLSERGVCIVNLDAEYEQISAESETEVESEVCADNLAYVIYTSGSTGVPKGVAIRHYSTLVMLDWAHRTFTPSQLSGVLASTSICFDLSVFELFVPLSCGGTVILVENILHLASSPVATDVTLINTVPSAIAELVRLGGVPDTVRTVNLAGESLTPELVQRVYERMRVENVYNLYGPSEDTTYSTQAQVERGATRVTIGRPIANTEAYILDKRMGVSPVGVAGELYIGGGGLARGYLNRPHLTAEKFVPHPFNSASGARLYRTGDIVRYLHDGEIEFIGRRDQQIKLRGFRIELGEIEAALRRHSSVSEAVVIVREDEPGDKRLIAYLVGAVNGDVDGVEWRAYLKERLPEYMIPQMFVTLAAMPLTANGKVDRRALPAPDQHAQQSEHDYVAPRTPEEELLAAIWADVLGVEPISIHDNFFERGGHSLLATQVIVRIREAFQVELPVRVLFEMPVLAALAEQIASLSGSHRERKEKVTQVFELLESITEEEARAFLKETR